MTSKRNHPHPGVVIIPRSLPSGSMRWQFRYRDADTGEVVRPMFKGEWRDTGKDVPRAVKLEAIAISKTIAKRRIAMEGGATVQSLNLADAVTSYFAGAQHQLRPKTIETYKLAVLPMVEWAKRHGATRTTDLNRARLVAYRDHLAAQPRRAAKAGVPARASKTETTEKRAPASVNKELRGIKTVLSYLRSAGYTRLTGDDLRDTLKPLRGKLERPDFMHAAQLRKLLGAAERYDAEKMITREDEARLRREAAKRGVARSAVKLAPGEGTPRYESIAPFVAFCMLSGVRRGEALTLRWSDVDLDALDVQGRRVGQFTVRADVSKTWQERVVGLEVSPALRALLAKLKLQAQQGLSDPDEVETLHVFGGREGYTADIVDKARRRLISEYGAPAFSWQILRSTCATYLVNAPSIFGASAAFLEAKQLGHSVTIAQNYYNGVLRGLPVEARDLETAMQVGAELKTLLVSMDRAGTSTNVVSLAEVRA